MALSDLPSSLQAPLDDLVAGLESRAQIPVIGSIAELLLHFLLRLFSRLGTMYARYEAGELTPPAPAPAPVSEKTVRTPAPRRQRRTASYRRRAPRPRPHSVRRPARHPAPPTAAPRPAPKPKQTSLQPRPHHARCRKNRACEASSSHALFIPLS